MDRISIAKLERSQLYLMRNQHVSGYAVLVANKDTDRLDALNTVERNLFFEDMTRAGNALMQAMDVPTLDSVIRQGDKQLHVRLIPHDLTGNSDPDAAQNTLSDAAYQRIIGDIREALGFIREAVEDENLHTYLDERGRVIDWPRKAKPDAQMAVRRYLAGKFEPSVRYTEREVNDLLKQWHTFEDWALLRRELFMHGFLRRMKDGSAYWRAEDDTVTV